jgi:hypothetical protein
MLNEYQFSADADDIRGAHLYSADRQDVGKVVDVIFDHETAAVRYLVADLGRGRKILVPSNHVYRSVVDERDFDTDISAPEIERLPRFDEKMMQAEKDWSTHEEEHRRAWEDHEERLQAAYRERWHEAPVQHRHGSDRDITPDEETAPSASAAAGERIVTGADLYPRRISGRFPGVGQPMMVPGDPNPGEIAMQPARETSEERGPLPSARWQAFQTRIRQNLDEIRQGCPACCPPGKRVA